MGIGVSVFLFAVGAILTFAVDATVSGIDIATVGVILMIAGALGLIMTMFVFGRRGRHPRDGRRGLRRRLRPPPGGAGRHPVIRRRGETREGPRVTGASLARSCR